MAVYNSKYTGQEIDDLLTKSKDVIDQKYLYNLLNPKEAYDGYVSATGSISPPDRVKQEQTCDFVCTPNTVYTVKLWTRSDANNWVGVGYYDAQGAFIKRDASRTTSNENIFTVIKFTFTTPANCALIKVAYTTFGTGFVGLFLSDVSPQYYSNGAAFHENKNLALMIPNSVYMNYPKYDTKNLTFTIPKLTQIINGGQNLYIVENEITVKFADDVGINVIYFDSINKTFDYRAATSSFNRQFFSDSELIVAVCRKTDSGYSIVECNCPVEIDGYIGGVYTSTTRKVLCSSKIKNISHRGYNSEAPENTIEGFALAKKRGYDYLECDLQFTSDNVPVIIHDSTINRTSNGTGSVSAMTYSQLLAYNFGYPSKFGDKYQNVKIPNFHKLVEFCHISGMVPYVEIKANPINDKYPDSLFEDILLLINYYKIPVNIMSTPSVDGIEHPLDNFLYDFNEYLSGKKIESGLGVGVVSYEIDSGISEINYLKNAINSEYSFIDKPLFFINQDHTNLILSQTQISNIIDNCELVLFTVDDVDSLTQDAYTYSNGYISNKRLISNDLSSNVGEYL